MKIFLIPVHWRSLMPETNDDRPTLIPTGDDDRHDTEPAPPPDFDDTVVDPHEEYLFL